MKKLLFLLFVLCSCTLFAQKTLSFRITHSFDDLDMRSLSLVYKKVFGEKAGLVVYNMSTRTIVAKSEGGLMEFKCIEYGGDDRTTKKATPPFTGKEIWVAKARLKSLNGLNGVNVEGMTDQWMSVGRYIIGIAKISSTEWELVALKEDYSNVIAFKMVEDVNIWLTDSDVGIVE